MAKKNGKDMIAYDPINGQPLFDEELPFTWSRDAKGCSIKELRPEYAGLSLVWKRNDPFFGRYRLLGISRTYSGSATADLENIDTGEEIDMYASEFNDVVDRLKEGGILEGDWIYRRKGGRYTLEGV